MLMLPLVPGAEIIFVTAKLPTERVLEYYLSFVPADRRHDTRARIRLIEVPDPTPRSITAKLLDRPDLIARDPDDDARPPGLYRAVERHTSGDGCRPTASGSRSTAPPRPVAARVQEQRPKTHAQRRGALPFGQEDVRCVADVLAAAEAIRRQHASAAGVVIKLDNSGAGDGNRVIRFDGLAPPPPSCRTPSSPWSRGISPTSRAEPSSRSSSPGTSSSSPSVQVDIAPGRRVNVVSTHEQLLGGASGQVYLGCRFPANPDYSSQLTSYGEAVGKLLADQGAMGRFCVDFAATRSPSSAWQIHGLEINLRKSGTSHPLSLLHNLVPGHYDADVGHLVGRARCRTLLPLDRQPRRPGLARASRRRRHRCRPTGRAGVRPKVRDRRGPPHVRRPRYRRSIGLTTIGRSAGHAERLYQAAVAAIEGASC